jgi:hypothetical protein
METDVVAAFSAFFLINRRICLRINPLKGLTINQGANAGSSMGIADPKYFY